MTDRERVIELIENGKENACCDFKKAFYHNEKYGDMIKDIVAFANSISCEDKYIIFNVDDDTREVGNNKIEILPDISNINGLMREYVEPYIDVEIDSFLYKSSNVAYIKITNNNMDKPYLIKKTYERKGQKILNQGDIFIRKNATNFKANRNDLDEIYDSREKRKIVVENDLVFSREYNINNVSQKIFMITFTFENNSKNNFLVSDVVIKIKVGDNSFSVKGRFLCDKEDMSLDTAHKIDEMPFSIEPNYTIRKIIGFQLSDQYIQKMKKKYGDAINCYVCLEMMNTNGKIIGTEYKECRMDFE